VTVRTLFIIAIILFGIVYYKEISGFVAGNAPDVNHSITKWFQEHTPKK